MNVYTRRYASPAGEMILAFDQENTLMRLVFPNEHARWALEVVRKGYTLIADTDRGEVALTQLDEYFARKRRTFDLALRPEGTAFQLKVWSALKTIPYGTTITYKQLADRIDNPAAVRAVGRANGANPIPIIVPCHRVIGADGSLTGFGGGLPLKELLLKLEGIETPQPAQAKLQLSLL